jgi:hypothetical protein
MRTYVSGLPHWISDTLCRLATGGGFAVRRLFTDQDEVLFDATRPVILNGMEDIVGQPDLADRAIFLTLEPIPEDLRRTEADLRTDFEAERPYILGALIDAVVEGLKRLPQTHLPGSPRMADFALWAAACETALWPAGTFWVAYCGNRDEAVEGVIESDPVAATLRALTLERTEWTGTASDLLPTLEDIAGKRVADSKAWANSPPALSGRLRRAAPALRKIGIEVTFDRGKGRKRNRLITIDAATIAARPDHGGKETVHTVRSVRWRSARSRERAFPADASADGKGQGGRKRRVARDEYRPQDCSELRACGRNGRCGRNLSPSICPKEHRRGCYAFFSSTRPRRRPPCFRNG